MELLTRNSPANFALLCTNLGRHNRQRAIPHKAVVNTDQDVVRGGGGEGDDGHVLELLPEAGELEVGGAEGVAPGEDGVND